MSKAVLVADLDGTIVDSRALEDLRNERRWKDCVQRLREATVFPEMADAIRDLRGNGVSIAIVTNSVSYYAEAVLRYHQIKYDALIAWHDTKLHKPSPEPIFEALRKVSAKPSAKLFGIGDALEDWQAYNAARLKTLGAGWSMTLERTAAWDAVLMNPAQLIEVFAT